MDSSVMWAFGIVASLFGFGFVFLFNRIEESKKVLTETANDDRKTMTAIGKEVDKNREDVGDFKSRLDVVAGTAAVLSKEVESKTSFQYVNDEFYKKEMAQIQFQNINQRFDEIKGDINGVKSSIEKLVDKMDKK